MPPNSLWDSVARALGLGKTGTSARDAEIQKCLMDLKDPLPDHRRSAAWTLGKFKPPPKGAVEALTALAEKDPDVSVRHSAQWALKAIRGL